MKRYRQPRPEEVRRQLEKALTLKDNKVAENFLNLALNLITPQQLKSAIESGADIVKTLFNHLHLSHPIVTPLLKLVLRIYWREVEEYLTSVPKIHALLSRRPDLAEILKTTEAKKYLNQQIPKLYRALYEVAWSE